jgi:hypothetical protein
MKKVFLLVFILGMVSITFGQKIGQSTIKRFSFGLDYYTDIWLKKPPDIDTRAINQGISVFGMYNYPFGESNFSIAVGIGTGFHNMYTKGQIEDIKADTITFIPIPDSIDYKRYKLGLSYIDIPLEFRFKTEKKFRVAVGAKFGFLIDGKTKYKGNREDGELVIIKQKSVENLQRFRFGPTLRIGYDWFNVFVYYQVTKVFEPGRGPDIYPLSVGLTLLPF